MFWNFKLDIAKHFIPTKNNLPGPQHRRKRNGNGYAANRLEDCRWHQTIHRLWHTRQFCSWDITYKILGPLVTIHVAGYLHGTRRQSIGIFASNTNGISRSHPPELLQKHQDVITAEYPHIACVIISGDLHCVSDDQIEAPYWIGSGLLQGSTVLGYNAIPCSIGLTRDFSRSNAVHTLP